MRQLCFLGYHRVLRHLHRQSLMMMTMKLMLPVSNEINMSARWLYRYRRYFLVMKTYHCRWTDNGFFHTFADSIRMCFGASITSSSCCIAAQCSTSANIFICCCSGIQTAKRSFWKRKFEDMNWRSSFKNDSEKHTTSLSAKSSNGCLTAWCSCRCTKSTMGSIAS